MASGFVYRCWTNDNRGSSGTFLVGLSMVIAAGVMWATVNGSKYAPSLSKIVSIATSKYAAVAGPPMTGLLVPGRPITGQVANLPRAQVFETVSYKTALTSGSAKSQAKSHVKKRAKRVHKAHVRRSSAVARAFRPSSARTHFVTAGSEYDGVASWYGPGFHGRRTASGPIYDMNELTAAHKTLPFGTKLLVTNKRNGLSTIVTINDRGPYITGRNLDLSKGAAQELDMIRPGVIPVEYKIL